MEMVCSICSVSNGVNSVPGYAVVELRVELREDVPAARVGLAAMALTNQFSRSVDPNLLGRRQLLMTHHHPHKSLCMIDSTAKVYSFSMAITDQSSSPLNMCARRAHLVSII